MIVYSLLLHICGKILEKYFKNGIVLESSVICHRTNADQGYSGY